MTFILINFYNSIVLREDSPKYRKAHVNESLYQFFTFSGIGLILLAIGVSLDVGTYIWGLVLPDMNSELKGLPIVYVPNALSVNSSYLTDSSNEHNEKNEQHYGNKEQDILILKRID